MNHDPHDPHEPSELSELFEQSASALDPLAHGRLRALARELPERRRAFLLLPPWAWAAGLCALTAVGAVGVVSLQATPAVKPVALRSLPSLASASEAQSQSPTAAVAPSDAADEVDELASSADLDDASGPNVFDDLALDPGDLADSEVDAWISAASATLGG